MKNNTSTAIAIIGTLCLLAATQAQVQTASTAHYVTKIPPDLYLTDDGNLFWGTSTSSALIASNVIERAKNSEESKPASADPSGNWGHTNGGFQASIRIKKNSFTVGEPIIATLLLRNVTTNKLQYLHVVTSEWPIPIDVVVSNKSDLLVRKDYSELLRASTRMTSLVPQTQHRFQVDLAKFWNFSEAGIYSVQAVKNLGRTNEQVVSGQIFFSISTDTNSSAKK